MTTLASLLENAAAEYPRHPAVRLDGLVMSYSELQDAAGRAGAQLSSLGLQPGDRLGVQLPNVPAFPVAFYGALAAGAVVVPMNPLLKSREVAYYLGDSGARLLLAWHAAAGEAGAGAAGTGTRVITIDEPDFRTQLGCSPLPAWVRRADDDDAVILYTSGTTGTPKGAELTHASLARNAELMARTVLPAPRLAGPAAPEGPHRQDRPRRGTPTAALPMTGPARAPDTICRVSVPHRVSGDCCYLSCA
jgi:long-chain acyl-CoA synthetase